MVYGIPGHVGTTLIIVDSPGLDFLLCALQGHEPVRIEAFIPAAAIEAFDDRIVRRLTRSGEVQGYSSLIRPSIQTFRDELQPIIA